VDRKFPIGISIDQGTLQKLDFMPEPWGHSRSGAIRRLVYMATEFGIDSKCRTLSLQTQEDTAAVEVVIER